MSGSHPEIPGELRQLAQAILDRLDPAVRVAATVAMGRGDSPGKCQQVWCPVCAVAALVQGEQHPMLDVIAEHSVAVLTAVRAMVDGASPPRDRDGPENPVPPSGRYQQIPIVLEDR